MSRKLMVVLALASALACLASTAAAAEAMTVKLGDPDLSNRIRIDVPVTVSCSAPDPSLTVFSQGIFVTVQQASGREIARGTGNAHGSLPNLLYPCDDADHTVPVTVLADTAGPPFHGGQAVVSAFANSTAGVPCFPWDPNNTCYFNTVSDSGSSGTTTLRLR
jgi:hypothetical protein